ncbi:polysaccharide deacetylase family protein [Dyella acidiphila]|uniref:Polysaccharide deacetylase family protein n=1 Tax=Dyella acidiphila TaxID=2775866 RepID=A0ABR9GD37_9GAMM|nr:polysaccharide deacetylase family protein [Dyella acidiphila]MBE1161966.1 polysaccharide deacetylase family protein [Dyella acidiphila]
MNMRPRKQHWLSLFPDALVQTKGSGRNNIRYLTFDDGPDPIYTPPLLDLLASHGVKASFFLVGQKIERHPKLVERIVAEGHMLGNHSYSHWSFKRMTTRKKLNEIHQTDALLSAFDGRLHHRMRPPHGYVGADLLCYFALHRRNFVYWSYDSLDYQERPTPVMVDRLRADPPSPGDIVLMHDDSDRARDALSVLLPEWLRDGHAFCALPQEAR